MAAPYLLAYLVTHRQRAQPRDLLAGPFWSDVPSDTARRRFSLALWQIRKALDPHQAMLSERDGVRLYLDLPSSTDVEQSVLLVTSDEGQVEISQGRGSEGWSGDCDSVRAGVGF